MKKFKLFLIGMLAAMVSLVATGCGSDDDGDVKQDAHNEIGVEKMHTLLATCKQKGVDYLIVDYRSAAEYQQGHVKGAIHTGVVGNETTMYSGSFAESVKVAAGNNLKTYIFLVGKADASLMMTLAGSVSSAGFGKTHTYILLGGYDAWAAAYPDEVE